MPSEPSPESVERAREFFKTYVPPDAAWYVEEVLVPGLARALDEREAAGRAAQREMDAKAIEAEAYQLYGAGSASIAQWWRAFAAALREGT